jgi:hypothetical protein
MEIIGPDLQGSLKKKLKNHAKAPSTHYMLFVAVLYMQQLVSICIHSHIIGFNLQVLSFYDNNTLQDFIEL